MASTKHRGWKWDHGNSRLNAQYDGVNIARVAAAGFSLLTGLTHTIAGTVTDSATTTKTGTLDASGATVTLPTRSAKLDLMPLVVDNAGLPLTATRTTNGTFHRYLGTNQWIIGSETANNETETSVGWISFQLPSDYKAGGTIGIRAGVDLVGAGTAVTSTIDFEAYLQDEVTGAVGSDLVTTAAQTIAAVEALEAFVVTPTALVAGDRLVVKMTTSVAETAMSDINANINSLYITYQADK